ncbi:MAG: hypothetical protein Q4C12_00045 [Clostridia bacterium]|nr:hypothetical protein [Clostridia bacterium]
MDKDATITTVFELADEFGNHYRSESTAEIVKSVGETKLDFMGEQFNIFLKQCGYVRKNDYIFMEDITEDEYIAISEFLSELRGGQADDN